VIRLCNELNRMVCRNAIVSPSTVKTAKSKRPITPQRACRRKKIGIADIC
jgi:hypothetical protein